MRYLFGLLCVCALGVVPLVGCSEAPACQSDEDCDDRNECTDDLCITGVGTCSYPPSRESEVCDDGDDNECVHGKCVGGLCAPVSEHDETLGWVRPGTPCESDGISGVCLCGLCKVEASECSTDDECDDDNECTDDFCDFCESCGADTWYTECDSCDRNGVPGVCIDGVCEEEPECSTDADCDDGIECTDDVCDDCYGCDNFVNCWDDDECTDDRCDLDTGGCSYPTFPDGTYCGCSDWYWGTCWPIISGFCCADEEHCQNGECV